MTKRFTGRHMAAIMIAFFGVVIAVNLLMARLAIGSFGGTVVDNSYVASQRFNTWLDAARRQEALGWRATLALDAARHVAITVSDGGAPIATAVAEHPLGRADDVILHFASAGPGRLRSVETLPPGRWAVSATIGRNGATTRLKETLR